MQTTFARSVLNSSSTPLPFLARFLRGGGYAQIKDRITQPIKDIIVIRGIEGVDSLIAFPVEICRFMVTLTPVNHKCNGYITNSNQNSQEVECCCYDMKIEVVPGGTPPPPICKFVVTLSDIDPFCCVQTLTSGWADGFPDPNNQIVLQTLNPAKALTIANPVTYRVCGRNTDGFVSVCLEAYDCNGFKYCERCSDPVPASLTCYYWTPSSVKNNEQFNESVTLKAPYPNPSNQTTTLSYTQKIDGVMEISIYDPQAKLVKTIEQKGFSGNSYSVDVYTSELADGVYFAKLNFNGLTREVKFIVKH